MNDLQIQYLQAEKEYDVQTKALQGKYAHISLLRLMLFVGAVAISIYLFSYSWVAATAFVFLFVMLFYRFILWHQKLLAKAAHIRKLAQINRLEANALGHEFQNFHDGHEFLASSHPYTPDLDIFGPYSIFQYCCRANTKIGQKKLAEYFLSPTDKSIIGKRQEAISELKENNHWRQNLMALGMGIKDDPRHIGNLHSWLKSEDYIIGSFFFKALLFLGPLWFFSVLTGWIFLFPWQVGFLLLLPIGILLKASHRKVDRIHQNTSKAAGILDLYAILIEHIESAEFKSDYLRELQSKLTLLPQKVSGELKRLDYIIRQLNVRYNFFAVFLNISFLWDLQWIYRLEKWKSRHKENLGSWFDVISELEALNSLATLWYNHPDWCLPVIGEEKKLECISLGHPLIHQSRCISNDFSMPVSGHIKLITGSNMAGKSTFLRTVGINMVLAQSGSPVCASSFSMPPTLVYSSMRTTDALHENTSSFYAELKRLKFIIQAVKDSGKNDQQTVFFLLDEILKGTNSTDRHTGSEALINQLLTLNGAGLIATHDLELGKMEATHEGTIQNLCMEVEVQNGELFFDYKLKPGVSKSFNATLLMKQMGIDVV